jgi:hypothetical protein
MDKRKLLWGVGLALALAFVFSSMFIPHLDTSGDTQGLEEEDPGIWNLAKASWQYWVTEEREGYPYTIHADENVHWGYTAAVQRTGSVFVDWATGDEVDQEGIFSLGGGVHERGFHLLLGQAQELTGISWFHIFQYGPAAWFTFTAFGVYATLRPHPAAIPAAAFVGLVPTTPRFLGPAILVPIGFSLAWLPATQILAKRGRKSFRAAFLMLTVVVWAFFVHLIGGFAAVGLLLMGGLVGRAAQRKRAFGLLGLGLIPLAWLYRSFSQGVQVKIDRVGDLPIDFTVFDGFGLWAIGLWAAGCILAPLLVHRLDEDNVIPTWAGTSMVSLGLIIASVTLFEKRPYATYDRWHPVFFFTAAIPAAFAVTEAGRLAWRTLEESLPDNRTVQRGIPTAAVTVSILLAGTAASTGVAVHVDQAYYHTIQDRDWDRYTWIRDNVGEEYEVFLAHPWKAPVLGAMTGKDPYTYLAPGSPPINEEDYRDYARSGGSLEFFVMNDITLVATPGKPPFEEFDRQREGVHTMDQNIAQEISEIREMADDRG